MTDATRLPELAGTLELDGRTYDVPLPSEVHYRELADWLVNRVLARIERQRGTVPDDVFEKRYEAVIRAVSADAFAPGTPEFDRALASLEAREELLWIVLHSKYPDAPRAAVRKLFQDGFNKAVEEARTKAQAKEKTA